MGAEVAYAEERFRRRGLGLDARDRAILMLVGVLELDQAAAARILRMPRGTLAWRLHEARARLRP